MSTLSFGPGTKVKMVATGSNAIGAVSTLCFYNGDTGHDEVDVRLLVVLGCCPSDQSHSSSSSPSASIILLASTINMLTAPRIS